VDETLVSVDMVDEVDEDEEEEEDDEELLLLLPLIKPIIELDVVAVELLLKLISSGF
jgi:hypothetical protein